MALTVPDLTRQGKDVLLIADVPGALPSYPWMRRAVIYRFHELRSMAFAIIRKADVGGIDPRGSSGPLDGRKVAIALILDICPTGPMSTKGAGGPDTYS